MTSIEPANPPTGRILQRLQKWEDHGHGERFEELVGGWIEPMIRLYGSDAPRRLLDHYLKWVTSSKQGKEKRDLVKREIEDNILSDTDLKPSEATDLILREIWATYEDRDWVLKLPRMIATWEKREVAFRRLEEPPDL